MTHLSETICLNPHENVQVITLHESVKQYVHRVENNEESRAAERTKQSVLLHSDSQTALW